MKIEYKKIHLKQIKKNNAQNKITHKRKKN